MAELEDSDLEGSKYDDGEAVLMEIVMEPLSWVRVIGVLFPSKVLTVWIKNDRMKNRIPFDMDTIIYVVIRIG